MKYEELYQEGLAALMNASLPEADSDCFILFSECFSLSRYSYFFKKDEIIADENKTELFRGWIKRRLDREPVQYIIGNQEFYGLKFLVDERVLIPRLDTEVLVDEVLKTDIKGKRMLDLCTGSGCILITCAKLGKTAYALGTDLSYDALNVAEENAKLNEVTVQLRQGDLFDAVGEEKFDIITSNPPYIADSERADLSAEVIDHEPHMALFADHDGLLMYERIISDINKYLNPGGRVFFEIGYAQGKAVAELCREAGLENIRVIKDLAGLDRVVTATKALP